MASIDDLGLSREQMGEFRGQLGDSGFLTLSGPCEHGMTNMLGRLLAERAPECIGALDDEAPLDAAAMVHITVSE